VGYERIQETQNPAIAIKRAIVDYQLQGRSTEWIDSRLRTILSRKELTDEWQKRGIKEGFEYGLLTDVISKHTFGKTTKEYRDHKNLSKNHSLRDNMSDIELILTMLGETSTRKIAQVKDAQGLEQNKEAAKAGGDIAGNARTDLEAKLGKSIVTSQNHLKQAPPSKHLLDFPGTFQEKIRAIAAVPAKPKKGLPDDQR
jgi:DNA-damage-inducible protein D